MPDVLEEVTQADASGASLNHERPRHVNTQANQPQFGFSEKVTVIYHPQSTEVETIAAVRNQLMSKHLGDGRRSIAICGATAGIGVSYLSVNLAVSMAQAGVNTLLIDCNLRDPSTEQYILSSQQKFGLADYLADPEKQDDPLISADVIPNLSVLFAGTPTDQPQQLLSGTRFQSLVENCLRSYDLTIVDCPPASTSSDARRIAGLLRYALVVARKDHSYLDDVRRLITELQTDRVKVIGTFLNAFK